MNSPLRKFSWQSAYSVGDAEIDAQHKRIIDILNLLYDLLHSDAVGKDFDEGLESIFAELHTYIAEHFAYEEARMAETDYPPADQVAHRATHAKLIARVLEFETAVASGSSASIAEVLPFIYGDWLIKHICEADAQYAPYLHG